MKNIILAIATGAAIFMVLRANNAGQTTTAGERIVLSEKNGFLVDQKGRVWI